MYSTAKLAKLTCPVVCNKLVIIFPVEIKEFATMFEVTVVLFEISSLELKPAAFEVLGITTLPVMFV
ncbi:hypothetical protein PBCV1_a017L [Paramecium bursaria Chlorella virus 1]|uniref:Uncharacterized protein n=1 Tax=Paramecium bursaria Chlorella virus 1 TaxID=10506 RepID=Q89352_PBCV1|nr:hypothetical protein PBCV1_a017L [Paramecium bursaria Chlorella virus 1]AAC96385.1 hypothetical protein [Paramecium bursaria Chlorella virus 1]